jgi:hypothetical protein
MKAFTLIIAIALTLCVLGWGICSFVIEQRAGIKMANLQLADDASTPEQKAKFLRAFLVEMDESNLPTHAAWVWPSERNKIANQKVVLESLIKRCDDLSTLDKNSMGYSQGMTQITGQEFDHVIGEIRPIYEKAIVMSYGWFTLNAWWIFILPGIVAWFFVYAAFCEY